MPGVLDSYPSAPSAHREEAAGLKDRPHMRENLPAAYDATTHCLQGRSAEASPLLTKPCVSCHRSRRCPAAARAGAVLWFPPCRKDTLLRRESRKAGKVLINLATGMEDAERVTVAFLVATAALDQGKRVVI